MASIANTTPVRNNVINNNNSPIASIKRPRNKPISKEDEENEKAQQPQKQQRWVSSAIFSPVLQFWNNKNAGEEEEEDDLDSSSPMQEESTEEEEVAMIIDEESTAPNGIEQQNDNNDNNDEEDTTQQPLDESNDESIIEEDIESTASEEFNPYLFMKHLPPHEQAIKDHIDFGRPLPPKSAKDPKISLVLDLDETLVHCTIDPTPDADLIFPVLFNGINYSVHVRKRPHLESFLEQMSSKFELICFTASQKVYADQLLDRIDPKRCIRYRLFRESCLPVSGNYLKDLNVLGRDLKHTILVDNSPHAFGYQVNNGIPILSWFDDREDKELLKLETFLETLVDVDDVRVPIRNVFQTWKLIQDA